MVAVMFGAVLLDRRALTLRAVAVAALLLMVVQPEALAEPGFQMSFAATTALVAVFGWMRDWRGPRLPRLLRPVSAVVISSTVAGLATAPYGAAHFNQVSHFGLIANLLAVPVMGALVMPGAVLAAVLAPVGLAWVALQMIRWPIAWILFVAERVSGLDGALGHVPSPAPLVLGLITAGGLVAVLATGRWRAVALAPLVLGLAIWADTTRPDVLVSPGGGLVGAMTQGGRALSKERGDGFAASSWLENDGDPVAQLVAHGRVRGDSGVFQLGTVRLVHLTGRGAAERVAAACADADIVVVSAEVPVPPPGCDLYDALRLAGTGALAIYAEGDGVRVVTEAEISGWRPWTRR
jgi:competence protein ComEC